MEIFLIDSNVLLNLELHYPKDIFPFFDKFYSMFEESKIFSVKAVYEELKDSKELWENHKEYFRDLNNDETEYMSKILEDTRFETFKLHGLNNNNEEEWADPHLIACALNNKNIIIVTDETLNSNPERKIPYVCKILEIKCMTFIEFLRYNNIKLNLI